MEREKHIDAVAGLMILCIGHLRQVCGYDWQTPSILYFFMPWFYYKSGMLSANKSLREMVHVGVRKMLKPFVVFALLGQIILTICLLMEGETSLKPYLYSPIRSLILGGCIGGNPPLWFIPSLMVTQCVSAWLLNERNLPVVWAGISLVLGYGMYWLDIPFLPTYIASSFLGLFFFMMGKVLRSWQHGNAWWIVLMACVVWISALIFNIHGSDVRGNSAGGGNYFIGALVSLAGCVAINGLFRLIQPAIRCCGLQYVGRNAMAFYVSHWIVFLLSVRLLAENILHINDGRMLCAVGAISLFVVPIFIEIKRYVTQRTHFN